MFLEGERVRLRPFDLADAPAMRAWVDDPEIVRLLGGVPYPFSLAAEEAAIREGLANGWEQGVHLSIEAMDGAEPALIGSIGLGNLHAEHRRGVLGVLIGEREYWSRGYGTDLMRTFTRFIFETMPVDRVYLKTLDWNYRAQRCFEKAGFRRYGTSRRGEYSFVLMEITRANFNNLTPENEK